MEELLYWIWFVGLEKISIKEKNVLLDRFDSPRCIHALSGTALTKAHLLREEQLAYFEQSKSLEPARRARDYLVRQEIQLLTREDARFPESLKNIYTPPVALFAKGQLSLLEESVKIAIVGSRNPTVMGKRYAETFARELAAVGITVVSGLAAGIDGQSHWGSLAELGGTIGVLGTGIDVCYPRANQKLFERMSREALILSEFALGAKPLPYHFPQRNRIISGLAQGVLVVEARKKSGSLITVNHALEQGKNVYVIPGAISEPQWAGGNQLLKEGAKLVTDPRDVLEDFIVVDRHKSNAISGATAQKLPADPDERALYELIQNGYRSIDELVVQSGLPVNAVNSLLTMMEIEEIITVEYGNIILV